MKNKNQNSCSPIVPRGTSLKPSYGNKFKPIAHDCVKWSERKVVLIRTHHGRDEILAEKIVEVEDCQQSSSCSFLGDILSFVQPLIPERERGKHRYALIVQAPSLDLFCEACWDDISVAWL